MKKKRPRYLNSDISRLIDEYIHSERDRALLKRRCDSRGRYMRSGESGRRYMRGESGGWECYGRSGDPHETVERLNEMMDETSDKRVKEIIQETIRLVESH